MLADIWITMFLRRCSGRFSLSGCTVCSVVENNNQLIRIMDNTANPQSKHGDSDQVTGGTASAQARPQPQPETSLLGALGAGIRQGAEDAITAAEKTIPKVKSAAIGAVYWTAYGVTFTAVFQWSLAKGLAPESLKSGCRNGVKAGREAAERWIEKLKQRKEKAPAASSERTGPSTEAGAA